MNIAQNIERASLFFPGKEAIVFERRSYTYRQLNEQVDRVANALHGLGVGRGDRVALYLPNIPEFAVAYLAAQKVGAVAVSLNSMLKTGEVQYIVNDSGSLVMFTTADLYPNLARDEMPSLKHVIIAEGDSRGELALDDVAARSASRFKATDMDRDEPAAILYTSGTTGFPKGATLTHGNVVSNIYATNHYSGMTPDDRLVLFLPLFHCFGQNFIMNSAFNACATVVMHRRFDLESVLDSVRRDQVTMFFAVPTIYIYLLNTAVSPHEWSSLRYCFTAAATMPKEIARAWQERFGLVIQEGYGLTESSPMASYNHHLRHKFGSVGTPVENVEMKIFDEEDNELGPGEWGEIVIRGPNVMKGYWGRQEDTARALRGGWLHSGDIGMTDDEGYFFIVDRVKDMINAAGFKVYPAEVEQVLYQHPAVQEAAVFGIPDPVKGEAVRANIVLKSGQTATEDEIIAFCKARIAAYKIPRSVAFVDSLPKSATGKILKRVLREELTG